MLIRGAPVPPVSGPSQNSPGSDDQNPTQRELPRGLGHKPPRTTLSVRMADARQKLHLLTGVTTLPALLELAPAMLPSSERGQRAEQVSRVPCPETSLSHRQGPLPATVLRSSSLRSCLSVCVVPAASLNLSGPDFKCAGTTFRISALLTSLRPFREE